MAQVSKTFKIGESAKGGVITVEIKGKVIIVIGKNWDFTQGSNKGSSQKNAKEFTRGAVLATEENARRKLSNFLKDLSTYYHSEQILKWIESKVKLESNTYW